MKKSYEHKKIEICKLCKKIIDTDFDDWCSLIDYRMQTQRAIGFFHASCLNDLIRGQGKAIQQNYTKKIMGMMRGIFTGKIPQEETPKEEFIKV